MSATIAVNKIESPSLARDNTAPQTSDGSFDREFEEAKKKIAQLIAPWAEAQKTFNFIPLEFKLDTTANKTEDAPKRDHPEQLKAKQEQNSAKKTESKEIAGNFTEKTTIPKENFSKNVPIPNIYIPAPQLYFGNVNSIKQPSKADLNILIDELVEKIELIKTSRKTELNLSLNYANMGDIMLKLSMENGAVSIQIAAKQNETKNFLNKNLSELECALKDAKIHLKDLKVVEVRYGDSSNGTS